MLSLFLTHLSFCLPELSLIILISTVLFIESSYEDSEKKRYFLDIFTASSLFISIVLLFMSLSLDKVLFSQTYFLNSQTQSVKIFFIIAFLGIFSFNRSKSQGESLILSLILLLGACILISSRHWSMTYLSIEMMSFMAYALVAFKKTRGALKAAFKYFFFGSLASGLFLLALAHLYGITKTLHYVPLTEATSYLNHLLYFSLFMKMSLIPFHYWSLEVYLESEVFVQYLFQLIPKAALIFLFYNLQKVIPLNKDFLIYFLAFQLFLGPYVFSRESSLRRVLSGYSFLSTAFMLTLFNSESYFKPLLYSLYVLIPSYLILFQERSSTIHSFIVFFAVLSLIGLPPFGGFFVKWIFIKELLLQKNFLLVSSVVGQSLGLIYIFYPRFKKKLFSNQVWLLGLEEIKMVVYLLVITLIGFFAPL